MKLKEIKNIYKSFEKYCWKSFFNSDSFHDKANILFGENGSGKSSICNILKSVCYKKPFSDNHNPSSILLNFDDEKCNYDGRAWDKQKSCNDILFFDKEFIQENIHLGSIRGSVKDGQEQKSGKMIIEFDKKAIDIRTAREEAKKIKDEYSNNLKQFKELHNEILNFNMTESQRELYEQLENIQFEELKQIYVNIIENIEKTQNLIKKDKELVQKTTEIQNTLNEIENEAFNLSLSDKSKYQSLFNFNLNEASKIQAEENLITKIKTNKDFFQAGIMINSNNPDKCPFCQSTTEGENISRIIRLYNDIYDESYKQQLEKFNKFKQNLFKEIENIITYVNNYDINQKFDILIKYHNSFKIDGLFLIEEKETFIKPITSSLSKLIKKIEDLHKPNFEDITENYDRMRTECDNIVEFFTKLNHFWETKNTIIKDFKNKNSAEQISERIAENEGIITKLNDKIKFLSDDIIINQKKRLAKEDELKKLTSQLKEKETTFTQTQTNYTDYCKGNVFQTTLDKMIAYFDKFNFPFSLELKSDNIGRKTEYPFSFIVKDSAGDERDFKEGLSEGELQVLSLCFFFAFLDIQDHLEDKILIFDDPISSLDNNYILRSRHS